ncbi:MAG: glycosyltransferase family 4 protein [Actinobacteria bacterium]|nr:glycosyltransferase family 4 protein [Actinomycetota bacterium]
MRVTHVAPTAFGAAGMFGGGERYPYELARAMSRLTPTKLVTFGTTTETRREDDLEIVTLKRIALLKGHPVHPVARGLRAQLKKADVVHAHHMRSAASRITALLTVPTSKALVVTDHGLGGGGWFGLLPRMFDAFLAVSEFSATTLAAPPERTHIIYGGCDPHRFCPDDGTREGVLFVGRITPHKGIDRLLRAIPPDVRLTIAGTAGHDPDPPENAYPQLLHDLARGKDVGFAGEIDEQRLPELYRRARVYVLPSVNVTCYGRRIEISELLGLSLLEAMASGTPVVATRTGGVPEVVRDGETGYLVEPGDEQELRSAIEDLLGDPKKAARMGRAGRDLVLEGFTWDKCARRCLAAYGAAA